MGAGTTSANRAWSVTHVFKLELVLTSVGIDSFGFAFGFGFGFGLGFVALLLGLRLPGRLRFSLCRSLPAVGSLDVRLKPFERHSLLDASEREGSTNLKSTFETSNLDPREELVSTYRCERSSTSHQWRELTVWPAMGQCIERCWKSVSFVPLQRRCVRYKCV